MTSRQPRHDDKSSEIDEILNQFFGSANTRYPETEVAVDTRGVRCATECRATEEPVGYLRFVDPDTDSNRRHEVSAKPVFSSVATGAEPMADKRLWDLKYKNSTKLSTVQKRRFGDMSEGLDKMNQRNTRSKTTTNPSRKQLSEAPSIEKKTSTNIASPSTPCLYELLSNSNFHCHTLKSIFTSPSSISSSPTAEIAEYGTELEDCIPLSPKKIPSRALHERAVMSAIKAVHDIASKGVLQARQRILRTRKRSTNDIQRPVYKSPKIDGTNKKDVTKHIDEIRDHLKHLCIDSHLRALVDRVKHLMITSYYEECEQANGELGGHAIIGGSLYVFFTEVWFSEWTEKLKKAKKSQCTRF